MTKEIPAYTVQHKSGGPAEDSKDTKGYEQGSVSDVSDESVQVKFDTMKEKGLEHYKKVCGLCLSTKQQSDIFGVALRVVESNARDRFRIIFVIIFLHHFWQNEYTRAVEFFSECIRICPSNTIGYSNRAACFVQLKNVR